MTEKVTWLALEPVDTLTFRGAEAMVAGESHEAVSLFPPLPSTFVGAVRTALLRQKKIAPHHYLADSGKYAELHPLLGFPENPGFNLVGPIFQLQSEAFFPAPAHWFKEKDSHSFQDVTVRVQSAQPLADGVAHLGLCGSVENPFWVYAPKAAELESLQGYWVSATAFSRANESSTIFNLELLTDPEKITAGTAALIHGCHLYDYEERFGIALESGTRRVKDGHLFASQYIRLKSGVNFLIGIVAPSTDDLADQGILQLGGEQRMCSYCKTSLSRLPENDSGDLAMNLSPVPAVALADEFLSHSWAGGKLLRVGGWDMQKGFHKDMVTYYPAGTVFQVSESFILPPGFIRI